MISNSMFPAWENSPIVAVVELPLNSHAIQNHTHMEGQLIGAVRGLVSIEAGDNRWVVPATHAIWIPSGIEHGSCSHGPFEGWSVLVTKSACVLLPQQPCILAVSGLLREAVARAAQWGTGTINEVQLRIAEVIFDEIRTLPRAALGLSIPQDPRLRRIALALSEDPANDRSLDDWAKWASIAPRTLTRRFVSETGFSFTEWRHRVRLLRALELLAAGRPVTSVALDLGYGNVSAFIALFKRSFGVTPGRYYNAIQAVQPVTAGLEKPE